MTARRQQKLVGRQLSLFRRGGRRAGAGRKPSGPRSLAPRDERPAIPHRCPVLVTTRLCPGLPSLRHPRVLDALQGPLAAGSSRFDFRLIHVSIQTNHLHLIAEAADSRALTRGLKGLFVRIARSLNRLWSRRGRVLVDRYVARVLRSPREVRNALVYTLLNARKHGCHVSTPDPYTSGAWFDGWKRLAGVGRGADVEDGVTRLASPRTWLLSVGWRRLGLIDPQARPASSASSG